MVKKHGLRINQSLIDNQFDSPLKVSQKLGELHRSIDSYTEYKKEQQLEK